MISKISDYKVFRVICKYRVRINRHDELGEVVGSHWRGFEEHAFTAIALNEDLAKMWVNQRFMTHHLMGHEFEIIRVEVLSDKVDCFIKVEHGW